MIMLAIEGDAGLEYHVALCALGSAGGARFHLGVRRVSRRPFSLKLEELVSLGGERDPTGAAQGGKR